MAKVKNKIPGLLTEGLLGLDFDFKNIDLNEYIQEAELPAQVEASAARVEARIANPLNQEVSVSQNAPIPLTETEALVIDQQIDETLLRLAAVKKKLKAFRADIDTAVLEAGVNKDLKFVVEVDKKHRIRKAMKILFGEKKNELTYTDYKQLLEAKVLLESQEAKAFTSGKIQ